MGMTSLDLMPEQMATLHLLLRRFMPGVTVWAYGSRVKGTARPYSDLDLVVFTTPGQRPLISELKEALDESNLPFPVDVLAWDDIPASFHRNIEEKYVVVQEGNEKASEGFRGIIERDRVAVQDKEEKERSVERLPVTWRFLSIDEIKSDENGAIAIGPFGSRMKADLYTDYGVPVIRGTNISETRSWKGEWVYISNEIADSMPNCNVKENDLVFHHRGSIGEVAIIPNDQPRYMLSTSLMKLRCDTKKANPLYVFYYFRSSEGRHQILKFASQVGTPGIGQPLTSLRSLRVPLPPIGEQRAIAAVLGALDDKIELNRRMNADLEAMARALFKDWFVDFGPVRAKAEGRPAYLVPEIWDFFPDALDDEDKPVGWRFGVLNEVADSPRRSVNPAEVSEDTPYIGLEHMPRSSVALADWAHAGKVTSNKSVFKKGEFLFGKLRPYFHKVGIAAINGICSTDIVVVCSKGKEWSAYVLACISSDPFVNYTNQLSNGAKMPRTSWDDMGAYEVCLPGKSVAQAFENTVTPMLEQVIVNIHESKTLAHLRDLLLPKLITGEIRVRDAEKAVEAAM